MFTKKSKLLLSSAILMSSLFFSSAHAFNLNGTVWSKASTQTDPKLLYAIALAESKKRADENRREVRPWPWTVNVNGKGTWFDTREDAEIFIKDFFAKGGNNIDIGIMQINYRWNGHLVSSPLDLLDIETSIKVAEIILKDAMASAPGDIELGIGRYHHWKDENVSRNYGRTVLSYRTGLERISTGR